jgi:hypothetical protein
MGVKSPLDQQADWIRKAVGEKPEIKLDDERSQPRSGIASNATESNWADGASASGRRRSNADPLRT